jgi:hypothetical protein
MARYGYALIVGTPPATLLREPPWPARPAGTNPPLGARRYSNVKTSPSSGCTSTVTTSPRPGTAWHASRTSNAETALARALDGHYARAGDEAYALIREALTASGDICPGNGQLLGAARGNGPLSLIAPAQRVWLYFGL